MLEIVFLIVTTGGIAAYARGRGGNPWLWGTISVAGHLLIQFFGGLVLALLHRSSDPDANTFIFHRLLRLGRGGRALHSILAGQRPGKTVRHVELF